MGFVTEEVRMEDKAFVGHNVADYVLSKVICTACADTER